MSKDTINTLNQYREKGSREYLRYNTFEEVDKAIAALYTKFYGKRLAKPFGSK